MVSLAPPQFLQAHIRACAVTKRSLSLCSGLVLALTVSVVAANLRQKEGTPSVALSAVLKRSENTDLHGEVESVTFLVTVNDTWWTWEQGGCLKTVKTPPIRPDTPWNESQSITVGKCDHGPLTFTLTHISENVMHN